MRLRARSATPRRRGRRALPVLALALALFAAALFPASSPAPIHVPPPPQLYWTTGGSAGTISHGTLIGSQLLEPRAVYSGEHFPAGLSLDPATNSVYWTGQTEGGVGVVRRGALDGGTTPSNVYEAPADGSLPLGLGIGGDGTSQSQLFWAQQPPGGGTWSIWSGAADGSQADELTQVPGGPLNALVVQWPIRQLYWANATAIESTRVYNPTQHAGVRATSAEIDAVAVVGSTSRIYWVAAEGGDLTVYGGILGKSDAVAIYEEEDSTPAGGLAVVGNSLYWTVDSAAGPGTIMRGNVDGVEPSEPQLVRAGLGAQRLAFLGAPSSLSAPEIWGGARIGEELHCDAGVWSGDDPARSSYSAPTTLVYRWSRGGEDLGGEKAITATESGYYRCTVTATNSVGGESVSSDIHWVLPSPSCNDTSLSTIVGAGIDGSLPCAGIGSLTYAILSGPGHGKLSSFDPATGGFRYEPDGGFTGTDSFTYRASESDAESAPATATIRVSADQRPAQAVVPPPSNRFGFLPQQANRRAGTVTLRLQVPGPGSLSLDGKAVRAVRERVGSAGVANLLVRPKPATRKRLLRRGHAKVWVVVGFTPDGGSPSSVGHSVTLRLKFHRKQIKGHHQPRWRTR